MLAEERGNLVMDKHPTEPGSTNTPSRFMLHAYRDRYRPDEKLDTYADFTFTLYHANLLNNNQLLKTWEPFLETLKRVRRQMYMYVVALFPSAPSFYITAFS